MAQSLLTQVKKAIPSLLTMLNLLSGCLAILISFQDPALAGLLILLAGVFDFLDGFAARLLNAWSEFGRELDSLADIISFGAAPSFILFHLINTSLVMEQPLFSLDGMPPAQLLILGTSFLPVMFAAIRLARFNIGNGGDAFSGLPSPAAGIFIASAAYILFTSDSIWVRETLFTPVVLASAGIILSVLMVTPVRMFSIKFSHFGLSGNKVRYIFLFPSLILFLWWGVPAIPLIIGWYVLLSVITSLIPIRE